jgi:pyruvate,water dikinase
VSGNIDRAGGIVFGLRDVSNYYVLRINAMEDNMILFEYVNSRRFERASAREPIRIGTWHDVGVHIQGTTVQGFLDGRLVLSYAATEPVHGFVGLWTKADSVTEFDKLTIKTGEHIRTIEFD